MRSINLEIELERVCGDSKITAYLKDGEVRVEYSGLQIDRLIERLVVNRHYKYVPYITARICGVCSHAHFWASNLAIENALNIVVDEATAELRDVCNKLQMVENHLIHLAFLALPDYKNLELDAISTAIRVRELVKDALNIVCGRLSGPQPYMPGGFIKNISKSYINKAIKLVEELAPLTNKIVDYVIDKIDLPPARDPFPTYLALSSWPKESVPVKEPYVLASNNSNVPINKENYLNYFNEVKPGYSNSKACTFNNQVFFVGARARLLAKRYLDLSSDILEVLRSNPYSNVIAKALETRYLVNDIIDKLRNIADKVPKKALPQRKSGRGLSVVEAPRGLLIHYYEVEEERVVKANIITPTVMFSKHIEASAESIVKQLYNDKAETSIISRHVEMLVRSYDPCIPCAVHVVKVRGS